MKVLGTENVGAFLSSMVMMLRPKRVLEIGAGYTTPFLLEALINNERVFDDGILKESYFRNYTYDAKLVIIDNQSLSYGMIDIQKRLPFIEIIHHPITFDYKYELASSKKIKYRISRYRWYSFLKMQKKVAPNIKRIITPSKSSREGIVSEFKCNKENITVINNGLDTDEFCPEDNSKRREYRLITISRASRCQT